MQTTLRCLILVGIALLFRTSAEAQARFRGGAFGMGGGAAPIATTGFMQGAFGQTVVGSAASGTAKHQAGFWQPVYIFLWNSVPGGDDGLPAAFQLFQNYPNPFNPVTHIRFDLPKASRVRISVYDIVGKEVATVAEGTWPAGFHSVDFRADNLATGFYVYRIEAEGFTDVKKLLVLK